MLRGGMAPELVAEFTKLPIDQLPNLDD
jgi:hypothetical protein